VPKKINLGLDLQGGMHLVLEVQAEKAVENAIERLREEVKRLLDKDKIEVAQLTREGATAILLKVAKAADRDKAQRALGDLPTLDKVPGATADECA